MGTSTVWQVTWNADLARYQICEQAGQGMVVSEIQVDGDAWLEWLERVSSFAFQSKEGSSPKEVSLLADTISVL